MGEYERVITSGDYPTGSRKLDFTSRLQQSINLLDSSTLVDVRSPGKEGPLSAASKDLVQPYTSRHVRNSAFDVSSYLTSLGSTMSFGAKTVDAMGVVRAPGDREVKLAVDHENAKKSLLSLHDAGSLVSSSVREMSDSYVSASFYEDFFLSLQENAAESQAFTLLDSFVRLCEDKLDELQQILSNLPSNQSKWRRVMDMRCALQSEANTWELLRLLYGDRLLRPAQDDDDALDGDFLFADTADSPMSERDYIELLYDRRSSLRQSQIVVNWIEQVAAKEMRNDSYDRYEYFSDKGFCCDCAISRAATLDVLEEGKRANVVTELDPDAPTRQQRRLVGLDEENRQSFLKCLFLYIRSGQMDEAIRLCEHYGEHWRAATLLGWRPFHDPNYTASPDTNGQVADTEGNPFRFVWKAACWKLSEEENMHSFEKAIYAAMCGNLDRLLAVCSTWEDQMWAHFRCMIDVRIESELRLHYNGRVNDFSQLPAAYWERMPTPESIFDELKANATTKVGCTSGFRCVQKHIILDDVEGLLQEICDGVKRGRQEASPDHSSFTRFAAHLVIFLRTVGACGSANESLCVAVLEEYVKVLVEEHLLRLVPAYAAKLPAKQQVFHYAHFLEGIKKRDEQQLCLRLAEDYGLDVALITKTVVENVRSRGSSANDGGIVAENMFQTEETATAALGMARVAEITADDQMKIDAIDWLMFEPLQRLEAMRQANALTRIFLVAHKLDAARATFNKIPPDSIDAILRQWQARAGPDASQAPVENTTREYLCLQAYLQAQDSFGDWFEHFHHGKPEALPAAPASGAPFAERMSYEHKQTQHMADMDRWRHTLDLQTRITIGKMYNVLLFVDGGWMVDQHPQSSEEEDADADADDGNKERTHQMMRLREICLPQVVLLLHSVLFSTGRYKKALELADVVASEQHQLYKVFSKQELRRLLAKFRESSLRLLDENLDSVGYVIQ